MSSMGDLWSDLQQRQLDAMKQFQDAVSETFKTWQSAMSPSGASDAAEAASKAWGQLPSPAQVADGYFKFAEEMLSRQHEFAMTLIEALTPKTGATPAGSGEGQTPEG
jgi:hypothetical protein